MAKKTWTGIIFSDMQQLILRASRQQEIKLGLYPESEVRYLSQIASLQKVRQALKSDQGWTIYCPVEAFGRVGRYEGYNYEYRLSVDSKTFTGKVVSLPSGSFVEFKEAYYFEHSFGVLRLQISRQNRYGTLGPSKTLITEPFAIALNQNKPIHNALREMSAYVNKQLRTLGQGLEKDTSFISYDWSEKDSGTQRLLNRLQIIERVLKIYEQQATYFRTNARFRLVLTEKVEHQTGKVNNFTEQTLRYIIEHPNNLVPSSNGNGLRIQNRHYLPRRTLVRTSQKTFELRENQIVLGFLQTLEKGLTEELQLLKQREIPTIPHIKSATGYVNSVELLLGEILERLNNYQQRISLCLKKVQRIFLQYREMLPVDSLVCQKMPPPSQIFLAIPAYRLIYDAMNHWFQLEKLSLAREDLLLESFERSQLYEYYCLLKQLELLQQGGLVLKKIERFCYTHPGKRFSQSSLPNTFYFEALDDLGQVTFFYEPVISTPRPGQPSSENGISLIRTSRMQWDKDGNISLLDGADLCYTPDYVVRIEKVGKAPRWFIADAKYRDSSKVLLEEAPKIMFKYFMSMNPCDRGSIIGVWLFYAFDGKEEMIPRFQSLHPENVKDIYFERLFPGVSFSPRWIPSILKIAQE